MPVRNDKRAKTTYRFGMPVFLLICALLWCALTVGYLLFGGTEPGSFQSSGLERGLAAAGIAVCVICVWFLCRWALGRFSVRSGKWRLFVLSCAAIITSLIMTVVIPFSPCHDSYDLLSFLEKLSLGEDTAYMTTYLAAFSTNRLTALLYFPFVQLFQSVEVGVRVLNGLLMCGSILLLAGCCKKMFGQNCAELSLLVSAIAFPYLLLVGPYIYLPAIFLAALTLYLYHCSPVVAKIGFFVAGGLLFTLRPMACVPILLYLFVKGWFRAGAKHRFLTGLGKTALSLACFFLIKSGTGALLYATDLHPYPNLDDSSLLWTLEVGTRYNGSATGQCVYFPYHSEGFDEISSQFGELWSAYETEYTAKQPVPYEEIKALKRAIGGNILTRTKDTILSSPGNVLGFAKAKYINYYSDVYRPYYYMPNILMPNFGDAAYHNYEARFFLSMNAFLLLFYTSAACLLLSAATRLCKRKKGLPASWSSCVALTLGALAVSLLAIFLTEVGKRLMFDAFAAMFPVICFALYRCTNLLKQISVKKEKAIAIGGAVLSAAGLFCLFNTYNITIFHGSTVTVSPGTVTIHFSGEITEPGYSLLLTDGTEIPLLGKTHVTLPNGENSDNFFSIRLPDGNLYQIAKQRRI